MAKVTSLTPDEQNTLSRLGKKLPKEAKKQDRQASSPAKEQKAPKATAVNQNSMQAQGSGSPGANMGHSMSTTPVKITTHTVKERS